MIHYFFKLLIASICLIFIALICFVMSILINLVFSIRYMLDSFKEMINYAWNEYLKVIKND
jgi:uncharacterized protein YybS (DUF2232 family)